MDTTDKLTQDLLHELFEYRDGVLYWKVAKSRRVKVGDVAGCLNDTVGYFYIQINKKRYLNHRIIFLMHHGYLPQCLDHIDGNAVNNRIENLRPATISENNRNSRIRKNNNSGVKGVSWDSKHKKWRVQVANKGRSKHIGYFNTIEKAAEVVKKAREELHGEFARHE